MFFWARHIVLNQITNSPIVRWDDLSCFCSRPAHKRMNNHEHLWILKHVTLHVLKQMGKKSKSKCNSDPALWSFWRKMKSNSIFLMNIKNPILHSWQVGVRRMMEIRGCSSSGVRTRAIKIKWWMVREVLQYLLQTYLHFACKSHCNVLGEQQIWMLSIIIVSFK